MVFSDFMPRDFSARSNLVAIFPVYTRNENLTWIALCLAPMTRT